MGVAILSGVIASLEHRVSQNAGPSTPTMFASQLPSATNGVSTPNMPGTMTPNINVDELPDASIPTRFLACVNRAETAKRLKATFRSTTGILAAENVEILWGENLRAVQESDVILLW
jgi:pyrroline-5-carboxylate reductase